jgi:asparagine synthase (glutamine-hydrolysing)
MCGIAGFWDFRAEIPDSRLRDFCGQMSDAIVHRGPDAGGCWVDEKVGLGLAHRRLSIIDLSSGAQQPMISNNNNLVIVFNGEIYNYLELKSELQSLGVVFRTTSDTEVLLEACAAWGVEEASSKCNGMFAFALWDKSLRRLWLVRDHMGIKPLYFSLQNGVLFFASELKALRGHPGFDARLDEAAAASMLRFGYVSGEHAIYQDVKRLTPGSMLSISAFSDTEIRPFWQFDDMAKTAVKSRASVSDLDAVNGLEELLRDSVRRQMLSDVPLGVLLSGGVDSSIVAALAQEASSKPIKSFAIGFDEAEYNEAHHAAEVASHLGTDHTELYVNPEQAIHLLPQMPELYDEPFGDNSQIPTYLVSALTREHVTVALSGDGGDELFGGYGRYFHGRDLLSKATQIPPFLCDAFVKTNRLLPSNVLDKLTGRLPSRIKINHLGSKLNKAAQFLEQKDPLKLYRMLMSHWGDMEGCRAGEIERHGIWWDRQLIKAIPDPIERMQYIDTLCYMQEDILTKVDRASMAVSLESRVPLLDHRVVSYAWSLAPHQKVRGDIGKWALKEVLYRFVPREIVDRPKMGFGVPVGTWLRGPLREWAEDLLSEDRLNETGLLDAQLVLRRWKEHLAGDLNWQYSLWPVLMFEAWRRHWL